VRKLKILFAGLSLCVLISMVGCKKTYNTTTVKTDSVFYSPWLTLNMQVFFDNNGDSIYIQDFTTKNLGASVLTKSLVIGYLGFPNSNGTDTIAENASEFAPTFETVFLTDTVEVSSVNYNFSTANSGYFYRYVIVPANVVSTYSPADLKKISFTDLSKALNTPLQGAAPKTTN
jgi:hypothetical protein